MNKQFWDWYIKQNYPFTPEQLWELDIKVKKDVLLGMMIHYLYDNGVSLKLPKVFDYFEDFYKWIDTGVQWISD